MLIKVTLADGDEQEYTVEGNVCIVGRSSKCQLVLPIEGISRQHCLIEIEGNKIYITDLDSTNGVLLNYQRIPPSTRTLYEAYFPLSFGPVKNMYIHPENYISSVKENPMFKQSMVRRHVAPLAPLEVEKKQTTTTTGKVTKIKEKSYSHSEMVEKQIRAQKRKQVLTNILVMLAVASTVLWYMNRKTEVPLKKELPVERISTEFD